MTIKEKVQILKAKSDVLYGMYKEARRAYSEGGSLNDFEAMIEYHAQHMEIDTLIWLLTDNTYAEDMKKIYCPKETR